MKITRRELRNLICEALDRETTNNLNEAFFVGHTVLNSGEMSLGRVFSESDDARSGEDSSASDDEVIAGLLKDAPGLYRAFIADGNPNQIQDLESQAGLVGMDFLSSVKKLKKVYKFPQSFIGGGVFPINGITALVTLQRMMHYYQFDKIRDYFNSKDAGNRTIVEWGGGYGGLSLLLFWYFDNLTVVIRDLPNVSIMQYIYLKTHIGNNVNLIQNSDDKIQKNKINLIPTNIEIDIETDLFVSFWALSESGVDDYNKLVNNSFYGASKIQLITQMGDDKFPVSKKINVMLSDDKIVSETVPGMGNNSKYFEADVIQFIGDNRD